MIVGTAGHIDHGKTTLVRALTGVDTDRLPEEKQRGISIELGYAFLDLPGPPARRIGFIDVPGHERLVHTMVSGAAGIDHALLLVAADDGVMPQTREHLAVLSLLGLSSAALVVTKSDRADAERRAAVQADCEALVAGTPLQGSPYFVVSATTGEGMAALREHLQLVAATTQAAEAGCAGFRLAVDRAFTLAGVGTVVTGTVFAGQVRVGDELALCPSRGGAAARLARVRSLHAQNRAVAEAGAGERCAVALVGVERDEIERGQWLVHPGVALASTRLDVLLTLWQGESRALRSGAAVHVHLGAASAMASMAVLEGGDALAPGATARVQLVLHQPLAAWRGSRVVLRDASASRTLAGGQVLDPFAPTRYRRTPQRMAELDAWALATPEARLEALLRAAPLGVDRARWQRAEGLLEPPAAVAADASAAVSADLRESATAGAVELHGDGWSLAARHVTAARQAVLQALAGYHHQHPDELGPDAARLRRLACPRLPEPLWRALLQHLLQTADVAIKGAFVHLVAHGVQLSAVDERIAQKIAPMLERAGFEGAWARDLARDAAESEPLMRVTLARLAQRGELHQVVRDLIYPNATMARLAALVRQVAAANDGVVTAAGYRDATQLGRKRAIQILEYLDRIGMLRRVGDGHRLRTDTRLFTAGSA